jgi:glycine betaine/proline transport system substrate-binding protein
MIKKVSKLVVLLAVMALFAGVIAGCGQQAQQQQGQEDKGTVELGYVQWDSEIASTNVVKKVLEDQGYEVKITAVDASPMWLGVSEGNFDGIVAAWLPATHKDYYAQVKDKVEDLGPNLQGAKIGLVVPEYVTINSIEELNSVKDKFQGKITGIEPGAGIMKATEQAIQDYNLDLDLQSSSSAGMAAALKKAEDNGDWIVALSIYTNTNAGKHGGEVNGKKTNFGYINAGQPGKGFIFPCGKSCPADPGPKEQV